MRDRWRYLDGHPRTCTCVECASRNARGQRRSGGAASGQTVVPRTPRRPKDAKAINPRTSSPPDTGRRQAKSSQHRVRPASAYSPSEQTVARGDPERAKQTKQPQKQSIAGQSTAPPPRYAPGSTLPPLTLRRRDTLSTMCRAAARLFSTGVIVVIAIYVGVVLIHFNNGFPAADALIEGVMADTEFAVNCRPSFGSFADFVNREFSAGHGLECR